MKFILIKQETKTLKHVYALLRGVGQILLQNSRVVGLLFLIGYFINSWRIACFGLFGLLCGYLAAFKFPADRKEAGLYGYNATLVGLAMGYFFGFSWGSLIAAGLGAAISTWVMHLMLHFKIRPFTFPFVVTTWVLFPILKMLGIMAASDQVFTITGTPQWISGLFLGFGVTMFQFNVITGALVFIALFWRSRLTVGYAALGSATGIFVPIILGFSSVSTYLGLFAFNAVLCGIVFAGKRGRDFMFAMVAFLLSIFIMWFFMLMKLDALTFPFVLSTWVTLWLKKNISVWE